MSDLTADKLAIREVVENWVIAMPGIGNALGPSGTPMAG